MIFIVVKFEAKDVYVERWPELVSEFTEATRQEPGNKWFEWSRSLEDPNEYVLLEAFDDDAAEPHVTSDHFRTAQKELPQYLNGTPAIINTVESNGYYKRAASLSGLNNISAPGVPIAVGIASLDSGGYNAGLDMWGGPFDSRWAKNDPTVQVNRLKNIPLWISAGNGVFGKYTPNPSPADIVQGVPLEILAKSQSEAFKAAADKAGVSAHYDFSSVGTHTWGYWSDQVWQMQLTGWFNS